MGQAAEGGMAHRGGAAEVQAFWNNRSTLGVHAGTRDLVAKQLEIEAIAHHVRDGMRVLDVGCGNGITALELGARFQIDLTGVDYAPEMIANARKLAEARRLRGVVRFDVADLRDPAGLTGGFDLIYCERVLINLPDWPAQRAAIESIGARLAPGGLFVMCENTQDGLDRLNALRRGVALPVITPPWHNRYLREAEVAAVVLPGITLERIVDYSSTYYFLSRVVNAWLAVREGREPEYEAPINQLALELPAFGDVGQGRIWLWRREGGSA